MYLLPDLIQRASFQAGGKTVLDAVHLSSHVLDCR
jgi:hypothetical protein